MDNKNIQGGINIPDIPEILKEKEQPKRKNKKPIFLISMFAVLALLIVAGIIYSSLNTVVIAGEKHKINETSLALYNTQLTVEDVESVSKMKSLTFIKLSGCTLPDNDLSWVTNATTIMLEDCSLTDAHISTIDFDSLDPVSIDLDGNKGITDLSVLTKVSDTLTTLSFNNCSVSDISFVSELRKLVSFYADFNSVSDISSLSSCTKLQILSLNNNSVASLEPLIDCLDLTMLNVKCNEITSLKGIEKCRYLNYLDLSDNKVSSLEYLPSFTKYNVHLDLKKNEIVSVVLPEASFSVLDLSDNYPESLDISATYGTTLIIGYIDSFDYSTVSGNFKNFKLIDVPNDVRDDIKEQITKGNVRFTTNEAGMVTQQKFDK